VTPAHVAEAFAYQGTACDSLGSPFMGQLMRLCATERWPESPITERIFAWQGEIGPRDQSVPLRLAAALHALCLQGHPVLAAVYPPQTASDEMLWQAVRTVLASEVAHLDRWLDSAPQTNEVRRSAVLIAVGHWLADRYGLPIRTSELGASGGLNLQWDRYALDIAEQRFGPEKPALILTPEWQGPLPPPTAPEVVSRAGIDLNPLDPSDPADALRLQAYLWPDQPHRLALTRAAIGAAQTRVSKGDAVEWLAGRLAHKRGTLHLIYSTVAWQYFPATAQALGSAMIAAAGAAATEDTPLAWFGMENDGGARGAALTLRLWPGDVTIALGRADFHGRWVAWEDTPLTMALAHIPAR
jgi:hypothetical protein